jgi:outer membrane lipopolysaccharide assembly protein LptE/RlpB
MRLRALPAVALATAACGYHVAKPGEVPGNQAIRVANFENYTAQVEAGGLFAAALRDELAARGKLGPEGSGGPELTGELLSLASTPSALGAQGASVYSVSAAVRVRLRDGSGVVYEDQVGAGEDYLAGVDVLGTEANRRAALRRLARTISRELLERMSVAARFPAGR